MRQGKILPIININIIQNIKWTFKFLMAIFWKSLVKKIAEECIKR